MLSRLFPLRVLTRLDLGSSSVQGPLAALSLNPSKTSARAGSAQARERRKHDPFLLAMTRQRKAANQSRQQALTKEREASVGDPIGSKPTEFVQKLQSRVDAQGSSLSHDGHYNHFLRGESLQGALEYSKDLSAPMSNPERAVSDPQFEKEQSGKHSQADANAQDAVRRIVSLESGNSKDRVRVNFMTCIDKFGRHQTDSVLPPKPAAYPQPPADARPEKTPRVGPDTGSPEVQVAILTSKILNLDRHLKTTRTDKHNKRNLRLLVHKRQKMLQYLRKKERGGPRFQHVMESLGLSDAAWKGEISF
jgi:ribosomal protein S15